FLCEANEAAPLPLEMPTMAWRRGFDLHPLDVRSQQDIDWLETLVWPDDIQRTERLRAAIETARADPPTIVKGNLVENLAVAASSAPKNATYSTLLFLDMYRTNQIVSVLPRSCATWEPCGSAMSRRMCFQGFASKRHSPCPPVVSCLQ